MCARPAAPPPTRSQRPPPRLHHPAHPSNPVRCSSKGAPAAAVDHLRARAQRRILVLLLLSNPVLVFSRALIFSRALVLVFSSVQDAALGRHLRQDGPHDVEDALDELPDWAAEALDNVVVIVEDHDPDDPDLLGVYVGIPLTERGHEPPLGPSRIIVYRRPLTEMCDSVEELREEIRITVLREIGHHFGIDEGRLDELGYA